MKTADTHMASRISKEMEHTFLKRSPHNHRRLSVRRPAVYVDVVIVFPLVVRMSSSIIINSHKLCQTVYPH